MLDNEARRFAIEDGRAHLAAQFDLIKSQDQKALSLLSLYVTLGIALVGLALTVFGKEPLIGTSAALGLAASSVSLFVGALYCFRTLEGERIHLPGRGFAFWKSAIEQAGDQFEDASNAYILDGEMQIKTMGELNAKLAKRFAVAKAAGIAAPVAAAIVGGLSAIAPYALAVF